MQILEGNTDMECLQKGEELLNNLFPDDKCEEDTNTHKSIRNYNLKLLNKEKPMVMITEVTDLIDKLNPKKSPGIDNISNNMIRHTKQFIAPILVKLFQKCLDLQYYPAEWKRAEAIIIPKPGKTDFNNYKNYRPLCLNSNISKILEKIINNRIIKYYEDFNLLSDRQHDFRRSKSTITALTEIIKIALEHKTREYAAIIAVDISAAFDNAWWPALMKRLDEDGCPQGGPLAPTLWNILINEILNNNLDDNCETIGYADDITLICWNKTPEQLRKTKDNVLRKINEWCESRKLKLSDEKTKKLYLYKCNSDIIVSGSKLIKPVEELKILGVTIKNHRVRSKLDFTPHVNETIIKVTRASGYLFGLTKKAWGLDFRRRLILYKTLYRSTITYGYPIWYPFINKKSKDKLNSLQYNILKHCIQAYSTTSSDCTHILAQVPKLTEYIESNMLKTEINYNRFDSSSRNIISNYIREKLQKYYEKTNTIFKSFFTDSQIPKYKQWVCYRMPVYGPKDLGGHCSKDVELNQWVCYRILVYGPKGLGGHCSKDVELNPGLWTERSGRPSASRV
ncbi:hypothetical protein LAZ67_5002909 [Cordylochernes scorpioides]|uniref:Reverse transcriptase domain-containing protein n=1 Tax=Cordylochernes scorpioides TaxID=51811 RepID=A0ABY6KGR9_9ARAC|nr:hypothetical protein LAZ67_5002909 [Cordylochernes scorpioides]